LIFNKFVYLEPFLFFKLKGTVRINDSARYPPKQYGYPPRIANFDEDLLGMDRLEIDGVSVALGRNTRTINSRPSNLNLYSNQFSERARQGYRYWVKDERDPVNNKRKGNLPDYTNYFDNLNTRHSFY
jgi:hypothetical protein